MPRRPHIVLADDLTSAAEVAAIAHHAGLRAVVLTRLPRGPVDTDVLVFDTDTRLTTPAGAVRRVASSVRHLLKLPHAGFFKKVDSVLRGPVRAELAACARVLGRRRTLLVPGNPSLGRIIRAGRYFIAGQPLHETAFARDPHHPRQTSVVLELFGASGHPPAVCLAPAVRLPREGIIIGEAGNLADVTHWAGAVKRDTLPAGGADFFRAWLQTQAGSRRAAPRYALPKGAALLLHGTTVAPVNARALLFHGLRAPPAVRVAAALRHQGAVAVAATAATLQDPRAPAAISLGFAGLAQSLHAAHAFRHLLVAGGATAATVLRGLGWSSLKVVRVWAPGVVTLQPADAPGFAVTLKPGSYPWPANLRHHLPGMLLS